MTQNGEAAAVEALGDRLKFLEDELLRSQPDYTVKDLDPKPRLRPYQKIPVKTKAEVEEEMKLRQQKALFGEMLPALKKKTVPVEYVPTPHSQTRKEKEAAEKRNKRQPVKIPQGGFLADLYARAAAAAEAERPKEDPNALPLAPLFYSERHEREFDKNILVYGSPESEEQYASLLKTYGEYLGGIEDDLYALWLRLGGTSNWKKYLRPTQLSLLLSKEKTLKVRFRVDPDHYPLLNGCMIEQREAAGFFSNIISRLPLLEFVEIIDCPVRPFTFPVLQGVHQPFPALKGLYALHVTWTVGDVLEFLKKYGKQIEAGKLRIDPHTTTFSDAHRREKLVEETNGKISYITPPHPCGLASS